MLGKYLMKTLIRAGLFGLSLVMAAPAMLSTVLAADKYILDSQHSQIVFSWNHLGYSDTTGMFAGFEGELMLDEENPEESSVKIKIAADSLMTGIPVLDDKLKEPALFDVAKHPNIFFDSTRISRTGENTADVQGQLYIKGKKQFVTLKVTLNKVAQHPMLGKRVAGFNATTILQRGDYDMAMGAPFVGNDVELRLSVEAIKAD